MQNWRISFHSFGTLFFKNLRYLLLLIALPLLVIIGFASFSLSQFVNNQIDLYSNQSLSSYHAYTETLLSNYFMQTTILSQDENIQMFLLHQPDSATYYDLKKIAPQIRNIMLTNDVIDSVYLYSLSSHEIYSDRRLTTKSDFYDPEAISAYETHTFTNRNWFLYRNSISNVPLITYYQLVGSPTAPQGVIIINFNFNELTRQLQELRSDHDFALYLVDTSGQYITSSFEKADLFPSNESIQLLLNGDSRVHDGNYFYYLSAFTYTDWNFLLAVPASLSQNQLSVFLEPMLILLVIAFIGIFATTFLISLRLYSPIQTIMKTVIDTVPEYVDIKKKHPEEETFITNVILNTVGQNKQMSKDMEQQLETLRQAQSIALQSQINPHFLYNTLDSISWAIVDLTQCENDASKMVVKLAAMLRYSLEDVNTLVPLEKELEYARDYLELQRLRYNDRFDVVWDIHPDSVQYPVIKLFLQPLLENAIYHGIKPLPSDVKGMITVKTEFTKDAFLVTVSDNGIGMEAAAVENLNQSFSSRDIRQKAHIGLQNVNQRIKLILSSSHGLEVRSSLRRGTDVICSLPFLPPTIPHRIDNE